MREYRTYFHIAQSWGINESTAYRMIRFCEDSLMDSGVFSLPGKKKLLESNHKIEVIVVDVTESPWATKKKQKLYYSGKKKRHTLKSQVVVDQATKQIICTTHGKGRKHDFSLFKSSYVRLQPQVMCLADKGYQGITKIHSNSRTPKKKPRGGTLSLEDKRLNRSLAQLRVVGEHLNRHLKIFKILSERYRNRRKRFGLRFNLIAGLYNYQLTLPS